MEKNLKGGAKNEKNLSAQKESAAQGARFQSENEDHGGAQSA